MKVKTQKKAYWHNTTNRKQYIRIDTCYPWFLLEHILIQRAKCQRYISGQYELFQWCQRYTQPKFRGDVLNTIKI